MAYQQNKPAASDRLSVSQGDIQGNFQALKTLIDVNHSTFGASTEGKHKFLQLPEQGSAPTVAANEAGLYAAVGAASTVSELVFRRESNGTAIAFTEGSLGASFADGWSRFPSGLIMKFGRATGNSLYSIDTSLIGPALTAIYGAQVTPVGAVTHSVTTLSVNTLEITLSATSTVYWQIIGKE